MVGLGVADWFELRFEFTFRFVFEVLVFSLAPKFPFTRAGSEKFALASTVRGVGVAVAEAICCAWMLRSPSPVGVPTCWTG